MAIGQGVLGEAVLDVAAVDELTSRLTAREAARSIEHAEQLADVLALSRVWAAAGMSLGTQAHLALVLSCSELRAGLLLRDAQVLQRLGGLTSMRAGLLTVEQARVVVDLLGSVDEALGASLRERLADRLAADRAEGVVRPPSRLRELLNRWLIAADPEAAAARRKDAAQADADIEVWKRDDGLVDLIGRALSPADALACSDRIDRLAQPLGPDDERTAGQRRQGALVDLLLGRIALPFDAVTGELSPLPVHCPQGSAAPCGASIFIHVPLATAADESTEPAELVGHGPIDPGLLAELLRADPVLHRVWVDADTGVPVAVDEQTWSPGRDPAALARALAEIRTGPPPEQRHPVHPDDHTHPPSTASPPDDVPDDDQTRPGSNASAQPPRVLSRPHLAHPGAYAPPRRLKRLLRARAPRCEWPGCGRRASRAAATGCDLDHDLAWPFGPTCACNIGPLCRRHHRIKQLGWTKHRQPDGSVRWTDPTGRSWTSPNQHAKPVVTPSPAVRRPIAPGVWALAA
jgi:hypothetical protein